MTCNNCGGEYPDTLGKCPFCGAENEKLAQKEQNEYVESYRNRQVDVDKIMDHKVKRAHVLLWKIAGLLLVVLLVGAVCSIFYSNRKAKRAFDEQQKKLEQMEVYYQSDDIGALTEYYDKVEAYETIFDKYREVIFAYRRVCEARGGIEDIYAHMAEYGRPGYSIDWKVENCFYALDYIQRIANAGYPYDNEEKVSGYLEQILQIMHESLGYSDKDITSGIEIYNSEKRDFTGLAEKALGYIEEKAAEGLK